MEYIYIELDQIFSANCYHAAFAPALISGSAIAYDLKSWRLLCMGLFSRFGVAANHTESRYCRDLVRLQ